MQNMTADSRAYSPESPRRPALKTLAKIAESKMTGWRRISLILLFCTGFVIEPPPTPGLRREGSRGVEKGIFKQ